MSEWQTIIGQINKLGAAVPNHDLYQISLPVAKAALEWCEVLRDIGAVSPLLLPDDGDLCLTWIVQSRKHYIVISADGQAYTTTLPR